jgi:group I intron endonuclease
MLIYKVTNQINQKSYVGKTELSLSRRKSNHLSDAKRGCEFAFHRALRKYGEEIFAWEVIEKDIEKSLLDDKERHYIALYESFGPKGYNMSEGGEGQTGWVPSDETRAKWSEQRKGKDPWNKGMSTPKKVLTEEERAARKADANRRRSESLKGRKTWNAGQVGTYTRSVYKVTYKDGSVKVGSRIELGLTEMAISYMRRDNCGSRKYNIKCIEKIDNPIVKD